METKITCIECPRGCMLTAATDECGAVHITGNLCPKGLTYGTTELTKPVRILTSTVKASGLSLPLIPVRTAQPIPKELLQAGMDHIRKLTVTQPVEAGTCLDENFLGLGISLIATRSVS